MIEKATAPPPAALLQGLDPGDTAQLYGRGAAEELVDGDADVGAALHRLELGKLGFPETKHIRRKPAQLRHFPNPEVKLVGNNNFA